MWELDHKKGWAPKKLILLNWSAGEDSWESLGCKEMKPVNSKGNQPSIFIGRTEAEAPILWPPDAKSQLIGKDLMLGKIEGKRRRGWQRIRWLDSITDSMDMNLSKLWETGEDSGVWHAAVHGVTKSWTRLSDWPTTTVEGGGTFIQYIDDLLICSPPQLQAIQHAIQVLSFLAEWSYKVSKSRAQLV